MSSANAQSLFLYCIPGVDVGRERGERNVTSVSPYCGSTKDALTDDIGSSTSDQGFRVQQFLLLPLVMVFAYFLGHLARWSEAVHHLENHDRPGCQRVRLQIG